MIYNFTPRLLRYQDLLATETQAKFKTFYRIEILKLKTLVK